MRILASLLLMCAFGLATAAGQRDVQRAASDDALLASAGVDASRVEMRGPCSAAVVDTDDPPEFFNCVFVQTNHDLNLFSLEDGYLMSELQLTLSNMDGVALQHMGRYAQVQVFSGDRVAVLYLHGPDWIDPARTEAVYRWLLAHGVRSRPARKWIGP